MTEVARIPINQTTQYFSDTTDPFEFLRTLSLLK